MARKFDNKVVVVTGGTGGDHQRVRNAGFSVYSATKAAVRNFARNWILDLNDRHIRTNAVSPGVTDTAGLKEPIGIGESAENTKNYLASLILAGRIVKLDEIARAVLFLSL